MESTARLEDILLRALLLLLATLGVNLIIATVYRLVVGRSWQELLARRFYEVFPVRALLWGIALAVAGALAVDVGAVVHATVSLFGSDGQPLTEKLIVSLAAAVALSGINWLFFAKVLRIGSLAPAAIDLAGVTPLNGINPALLAEVGHERFPTQASKAYWTEIGLRFATFAVPCGLLVIIFRGDLPAGIGFFERLTPVEAAVGWMLAGVVIALIFGNHDYTKVPFYAVLAIEAFITGCIVLDGALRDADAKEVVIAAAVVTGLFGARALVDLVRALIHSRVEDVLNTLRGSIARAIPGLGGLSEGLLKLLPPLDVEALAERLTSGCHKIETSSLLIPRRMAELIRVSDVHYQAIVSATYRLLTVRRFVTLSSSSPTTDSVREPSVPKWDRVLFPLAVPVGYKNQHDEVTLGSKWDVVRVCWRCGGSGTVTETASRTETVYQNGQTVTRTVFYTVVKVCPICLGMTRLKYRQILHTKWQAVSATVTSPKLGATSLVEGAEEATFYRKRLREDFDPDIGESERDDRLGSNVIATLDAAADALESASAADHAEVAELTDGQVYRSELSINGLYVVSMRFGRGGSRVGWFFGASPRMYMPRPPFSYSAAVTCLVAPPLLLGLLLALIGTAQAWSLGRFPYTPLF